ncbi:MAG: murein transglycosylase [Planctomycetes bacterium]|nr:murein transglycosylase [Planctomycetota bacterium]
MNPTRLVLPSLLAAALAAGCTAPEPEPEWGRPLPDGAPALIPLGPDEPRPDFAADWDARERVLRAVERSLEWTTKPSAPRFFPIEGVSHERALASLTRFGELLSTSRSGEDFAQALDEEFQVYRSAGWDGRGGGVLFTGYCTPILDGSRERSGEYQHALYALPPDLVKDKEGNILGQQTAAGLRPYPDRRTIERTGLLEGKSLELAWLRDPLDAFIAHVNGSAFIKLREGGMLRLGYAGKNGKPYTSLRKELIADGRIAADGANLRTIRDWAREHPDQVPEYLQRNASYVFFTPIEGNPRGSLNVEVTGERTLATDKSLFPRGAVCFVDTRVGAGGGGRSFRQFMLDQDTGGAIRTAGRADIYLGSGPTAERLAGTTEQEGQLYYLFLKD